MLLTILAPEHNEEHGGHHLLGRLSVRVIKRLSRDHGEEQTPRQWDRCEPHRPNLKWGCPSSYPTLPSRIYSQFKYKMASLVAQMVKSLPAVQETQVQSLGWGDPLKKEMTTHSNILDWRIPWVKEPGRLRSMGSQRVRHD